MRYQVFETYEALSEAAANCIAEQLRTKPTSVLGLATGSTPLGTYRDLIALHRKGLCSAAAATSFNLDEYYPLAADEPQSYHTYMHENFFSAMDFAPERIHIPSGDAPDVDAACAAYDAAIAAAGGIDLQLLGIGENGHIGFNEPGTQLHVPTHLTPLTDSTIRANARFFRSEAEVPRHAVTMGMGSIFLARRILILASGAAKKEAVRRLLADGFISTDCPATLLKLHPDCLLLCDREAYGA